MRVVVNGEPRTVTDGASVQELLRAIGLDEVRVAVEVNRSVVTRAEHARRKLAEGDVIEIVHFVGGG